MVKYIENYALYQSIGSGVYGKVYRAINNNDKKEYAVKVIPIAKFRQNKKLQECTVNEINILTNIENNQHIIRYFDMLKTSNNFYFIYEYCNGGTLENLLSKQGKLSEQSALLIFKQLLQAFQVLNKYNIMHRDMKPDNIFFHNGIIKLGDFGFCKNLNSADEMTKTMLGSPIYMAPEVLKGQIYSNKADIWSLGVVLYQMIFGHCPFQSNSIAKLIQVLDTKELQFPGNISPFLKDLIQKMLTKDASKRTGWMELLTIKINSQGSIENQKVTPNISSLSDAKFLDDNNALTSTKYTPPAKKQNPIQTSTSNQNINSTNNTQNSPTLSQTVDPSFKKNRNPSHMVSTNPVSQTNTANIFTSNGSSQQNLIQSKPIGQSSSKITEDHKVVLEGVKLSMEVVDSRLPNYSGYTNLILSKNIVLLENLLQKPFRREIIQILEKQLKQMKAQKQSIASKMFAYQLKGLDDWKKYMRGKFFEDQKTIAIWYKMITFLSSKGIQKVNMNLTSAQMTQSIKNILY